MTAHIIRKRLNALLVLLVLGVGFITAYGASAAGKKPRGEDWTVDPRHEQAGTWACSGVTTAPYGTERPYYGVLQNEWTLDHKWMVVHFAEQKPVTAQPLVEDQYWGYTEATGKHTRNIMANDGTFGVLSSDGWQNNVMQWQGTYTIANANYTYHEGIERYSADRYRWFGSIEDNGTVLVRYDMTCKKK